MKKGNFRSFVSGILATVFCAGLIGTASASVGQRTMVADCQNIRITLDGVELTPTDANGNIVEPFSVDGTTYLPVRAIATAMGLGVDWDGSTGTVVLSTPTQDPLPELPQPSLPPLQTPAPEETGSGDWFDALSDGEKHDLTFAFLRTWIQTASNDTLNGSAAYTETFDNFRYTLVYDSSSDQVILMVLEGFDDGSAVTALYLTDSSRLWPTDGNPSYFGCYNRYFNDGKPVAEITCFVPILTFSESSGYKASKYSGDDSMRTSHENLSSALFADSLTFLASVFDTDISQYGPYSLSNLGFQNF